MFRTVLLDWLIHFHAVRHVRVHVCSSEIKVDCIRVNALPIKTIIDDHIQRLFDALLGSLRRSIQSDITEIESFVTAAIETLSQRPQTVEEIGEANGKHMEFTKRKKEVVIYSLFGWKIIDATSKIASTVQFSCSADSLFGLDPSISWLDETVNKVLVSFIRFIVHIYSFI